MVGGAVQVTSNAAGQSPLGAQANPGARGLIVTIQIDAEGDTALDVDVYGILPNGKTWRLMPQAQFQGLNVNPEDVFPYVIYPASLDANAEVVTVAGVVPPWWAVWVQEDLAGTVHWTITIFWAYLW
jgi:hypothetical protein